MEPGLAQRELMDEVDDALVEVKRQLDLAQIAQRNTLKVALQKLVALTPRLNELDLL